MNFGILTKIDFSDSHAKPIYKQTYIGFGIISRIDSKLHTDFLRSEAQALDSKQKTTALGLALDSLSDRQKSSRHPVWENLILIFYVLIIFSGKRNKISLPEAVKYITLFDPPGVKKPT